MADKGEGDDGAGGSAGKKRAPRKAAGAKWQVKEEEEEAEEDVAAAGAGICRCTFCMRMQLICCRATMHARPFPSLSLYSSAVLSANPELYPVQLSLSTSGIPASNPILRTTLCCRRQQADRGPAGSRAG